MKLKTRRNSEHEGWAGNTLNSTKGQQGSWCMGMGTEALQSNETGEHGTPHGPLEGAQHLGQ